jgi:hemoglobin
VDQNFFDEVGGHDTFARLTARFYEGVAADPVLKPMYPEEDLEPARQRLQLFLEQYWGGPTTYSDTRGHPRLRLRHQPYKINPHARQRWLDHMTVAVDSLELAPLQRETLMDYLTRAATAMLNTFDD